MESSAARIPELAKRVLFAAVAGPATVLLVRLGGLPLALLISAASGVAAWELYRLARAAGSQPIEAIGIPLAALLPLYAGTEPRGVFDASPALIAGMLLLVLTVAIWTRGASGQPLSAVATTLFGVGYTGGLLAFGIAIRNHRYVTSDVGGAVLLLLPVLATWINDIGAYAAGHIVGGRKLIPSVSPGKTVAGAVGGLIATVLFSWLYVSWVLEPVAQLAMRRGTLLLFAVAVGVAGQVGDLAESLLKREAGAKDSSHLFPGHGGVLDRIDSLLFALPVAWAIFTLPGVLVVKL